MATPRVLWLENKRALVAEAGSPAGFLISNILQGYGMEVGVVETSEQAIHALRRAAISFLPHHILILDERILHQIDSHSAETIRRASGNRGLRVILVADEEPVERAGVDAVIRRPVEEEALLAALREMLGAEENVPAGKRPRKNILIVEDDPLSLELMRIVLTKNGYDVTLAPGGTEAVEACRHTSFDLIFMDLQMPDMDGFAASARIREMESPDRHVPIVALTASNISPKAYEQFKAEFARILTKPFHIPTILNTIEEFTGGGAGSISPCAPDEEAGLLNMPKALRHFGMDVEQYQQIFVEFQESLAGRLIEIEGTLADRDMPGLARRAHNLKGAAANVGAMQLSQVAARLDEPDASPDWERAEQVVDEIRAAMKTLEASAQHYIEEFLSITPIPMRET